MPKDAAIKLPERHLGLVPAQEKRPDSGLYAKLRALVEKNIDVRRLIKISRQAPVNLSFPLARRPWLGFQMAQATKAACLPAGRESRLLDSLQVTIAIARDKAFNFYYQDNLDILKSLGARLVEFSPLKDKSLPPGIDGLYIGGGYPELFAAQLSANIRMRKAILQYAGEGLPIYAECAGLMYLVNKIVDFRVRPFQCAGFLIVRRLWPTSAKPWGI